MTVLFIEVLSVVVSLDVVVMLHDLSTMVLAITLLMLGTVVPSVVCIGVLQRQVHLRALVVGRFGYHVAIHSLVVAVIEVTDKRQYLISPLVPLRHQHQSLLAEDVGPL